MPIDRNALAADLSAMIADLSETFEWNDGTYTGSITDVRREAKTTEFAVDTEIALMLRVCISDLPAGTLPKSRDRITLLNQRIDVTPTMLDRSGYGPRNYEVIETMLDRDGIGLRIMLREDRRNVQ